MEHQEVHGNMYGTHKKQVDDASRQGKICVLDIDVKGALTIAQEGKIECNYLFIKVPSIEELRARLTARGSETEETLAKRLSNAENELKQAVDHPEVFKKYIVNDK